MFPIRIDLAFLNPNPQQKIKYPSPPPRPAHTPTKKILTEGIEPPLEDEGPANDGEDQGGGALPHRVVEDARYAHFRGQNLLLSERINKNDHSPQIIYITAT